MSDPFALLSLPRRPLLSEEEVGSAYRKLAGELHPDREGGDAQAFLALGEAAAILRDPPRRLRELTGAATESQLPARAAELFPKVASILQQADAVLAREAASSQALARALLAAPAKKTSAELDQILALIQEWRASLDRELEEMDRRWPKHDPATVTNLADSFTYVLRWKAQLSERRLSLGSIHG